MTSADGTAIGYETAGDGPIVILIDGAMCFRDSGPARGIARELASDFTVVLYDRRGRGASGDTLPASVGREIEDVAGLIDEVGVPAALVGLSSGGALALASAEALVDRVSHLAVYEPPYMPEQLLAGAAEYTRQLTAALDAGDRGAAVAAFLARVGTPSQAIEGMRHSPGWAAMEAIAPTLAYDDAAMGDSAVPVDRAQRLTTPTLALAGAASPAMLRYGAETLATAMPRARFELVAGQTHDIDPHALAATIRPFLES